MSSEWPDQPATPEEQPGGLPGKTLAAQREAMGWTVEQVADQLKLAVRQVIALEAGDYAALPSPAVVRGFIRAYAKIVRLDPAPLVAMIPMDTAAPAETATVARPQKPATFSESSRFPMHGKRSTLPVAWIALAVVVVVAAAAAWHLGLIPHGKGSAPANPVAAPAPAQPGTTSEPLQKPDVPLISVPGQQNPAPAGDVQPGNAQPATGAPAPGGNAPAPAAPAAPATGAGATPTAAQPAPAPAPVQAAAETAVTTTPANALVLNVNEDSWIQVTTADGRKLISRLVKAGSTETVPVDQPVNMIVGNPKGVSASLRGAPVELPMLPGKTISRVSLK